MKPIFLKISPLLNAVPHRAWQRGCNQNIIFPFFHAVDDNEKPHLKYAYPVRTIKQFKNDLDWFMLHYEPISYHDLLDAGIRRDRNKKYFLLSFDDGLKSIYTLIAPILKEKGIPAIFFINTGFADNKDLFYRYKASLIHTKLDQISNKHQALASLSEILKTPSDKTFIFNELQQVTYKNKYLLDNCAEALGIDFKMFLKHEQPYMSWYEILDLHKQGFTVGAHSVSHPFYNQLSLHEQLKETCDSIKEINSRLGADNVPFSFPFTDYGVSTQFFESLHKEFGNDFYTFGTAGLKRDTAINHIQRIPLEIEHYSAESIINAEYYYWLMKKALGKNLIKRA